MSPAAIAEWRVRTFEGLRAPARAGLHDVLPLDPLDDPEAAWEAIERLRRG